MCACMAKSHASPVLQTAQGALALLGFYLVLHIVSFSALILVSRRKQN